MKHVHYRPDRLYRPRTQLPVSALAPDDAWCDDPGHPEYNRPVKRPFSAGHEVMWRKDHLYDVVVVLAHNDTPTVAGRGSAVFFHIAQPDYGPTEGCAAVALNHMLCILERCGPGTSLQFSR